MWFSAPVSGNSQPTAYVRLLLQKLWLSLLASFTPAHMCVYTQTHKSFKNKSLGHLFYKLKYNFWLKKFSLSWAIPWMGKHSPEKVVQKSYNWLCACSNLSRCLASTKRTVEGRAFLVWEPGGCEQEQAKSLCNISLGVSDRHFELLPKLTEDKPISFPCFPPLPLSHSVLAASIILLGETERLSLVLILWLWALSICMMNGDWSSSETWAKLCLITGHWYSWRLLIVTWYWGTVLGLREEGLSQVLLAFLLQMERSSYIWYTVLLLMSQPYQWKAEKHPLTTQTQQKDKGHDDSPKYNVFSLAVVRPSTWEGPSDIDEGPWHSESYRSIHHWVWNGLWCLSPGIRVSFT